MRNIVLCVFMLVIAVATVSAKPRETRDAAEYRTICLNENNITSEELFDLKDLENDKHKESENEEKGRKTGCYFECIMRKSGIMEGMDINEEKLIDDVRGKIKNEHVTSFAVNAMHTCLPKVSDITEECKKGLALVACFAKNHKKQRDEHEEHEEHHEHA